MVDIVQRLQQAQLNPNVVMEAIEMINGLRTDYARVRAENAWLQQMLKAASDDDMAA